MLMMSYRFSNMRRYLVNARYAQLLRSFGSLISRFLQCSVEFPLPVTFFINSVCTIYLKVSQRITWPSHSYATHTHTQSTWTEPEQRKKPLRAQTYFCNSRSLLRSRSATSRFALLSRSIVFCHAPLHPTFGPFRSVIRSAHAPLTCSAHTCQLVSVSWNWAGQRA